MRKIGISDFSTKPTNFYNLDMIISVGYRVKSHQGIHFRKWATAVIKEYLIKGFAMNDELLKEAGGGNYFDELLERIRDIRSSEKIFWRKVLDVYATSIDYDHKTQQSITVFKTIQNKMHWAALDDGDFEVIDGQEVPKYQKWDDNIQEIANSKLRLQWRPEQISGWLKINQNISIS